MHSLSHHNALPSFQQLPIIWISSIILTMPLVHVTWLPKGEYVPVRTLVHVNRNESDCAMLVSLATMTP